MKQIEFVASLGHGAILDDTDDRGIVLHSVRESRWKADRARPCLVDVDAAEIPEALDPLFFCVSSAGDAGRGRPHPHRDRGRALRRRRRATFWSTPLAMS